MRQFIIKTFLKHKAVIVYMVDETGKVNPYWCIPDKDFSVVIPERAEAVLLSREATHFTTKRNIPTYFVKYSNADAVNLNNINKGIHTAAQFEEIKTNDQAQKIFKSMKKGAWTDETKLILAFMVLGFLILGYFFNSQISDIKDIVNTPDPTPIVEVEEEEEANPYA